MGPADKRALEVNRVSGAPDSRSVLEASDGAVSAAIGRWPACTHWLGIAQPNQGTRSCRH